MFDREADTSIARLVSDAAKMVVAKALLERLDDKDIALPAMALGRCAERLRRDHWKADQARNLGQGFDMGRSIADLMRVDRELGEEVFSMSRADLIIDELRAFCREHKVGR